MASLIYLRFFVLTLGTLLPFFWIVVILGHRRQRNFERIFFFLCLALVFVFGGSLLALNAELFYDVTPRLLQIFAWALVCIGLWFLPSLLVHLHLEYACVRELLRPGISTRLKLLASYLPAIILLPSLVAALGPHTVPNFLFPSKVLGTAFQSWLALAFLLSAFWQRRFVGVAPDQAQRSFHVGLFANFALLALALIAAQLFLRNSSAGTPSAEFWHDLFLFLEVAPLFGLLRSVQKFNFLQIGRQRNLLYAVFAAFVGLLYLSFVRRVGLWLEPYFPPESTAALLLFFPVVLFEPLQRLVGRLLLRAAQSEVDQVSRTMGPIQDMARLGNVERLRSFAEQHIAQQLQLAKVELALGSEHKVVFPLDAADEEFFPIRKFNDVLGVLRAQPYGAMLSGETTAALEFLCEQLPSAFDLCALIEEKLRLERELAERERLAALGQMAASISHNLKNPLGSIKTILQVQLESSDMPASLKAETKMILAEISRLSGKLNQLLQFSRPAVLGEATDGCEVSEVIAEVSAVLRHEAARKSVQLHTSANTALSVAAAKEAVNDIVSNLILNGLEAATAGGQVNVSAAHLDGKALLRVEDDGKGIPPELREKVLQPFFTTKTQGTGLGLAIVAKRVAEANGSLELESPIASDRGTRFSVWLPLREEGK